MCYKGPAQMATKLTIRGVIELAVLAGIVWGGLGLVDSVFGVAASFWVAGAALVISVILFLMLRSNR